MNERTPDNLGRWIAAGLVAGAIVIGVAVAAYAVGYHRGEHHNASSAPAVVPAPTTTSAPTTTAATTVSATPALIARGKTLFTSDGCSACHSLSGAAGAGPSLKGLPGSDVALANGQTVTADDAYLERSITDPDAEVVKGYHAGIMAPAISGFGLDRKPDDVRALVAFIDTQH